MSGFNLNVKVTHVQITVPLLETLVTEMRKAKDRNLPYDFSHYIMISKLYKTKMELDQDHQVGDSHCLFIFLLQLPLCLGVGLVLYKVGTSF